MEKKKIEIIFNKILSDFKDVKPTCDLEKLPSFLILKIISYLNVRELEKVSRCNKFLLKTVFNSKISTLIWKEHLKGIYTEEQIEENSIFDQSNLNIFERGCDKLMLAFKHMSLRFDPVRKGQFTSFNKERTIATNMDRGGNYSNAFLEKPLMKGINYFEFKCNYKNQFFFWYKKIFFFYFYYTIVLFFLIVVYVKNTK